MAKKRTASPSTDGVKPRMMKMYDGRNVATRPIPIITDTSEQRAIAAAAADSQPKVRAVNMPSGPRPKGAEVVYGTSVASPGNVIQGRSAVWNPLIGTDNFE